MERRSFLKKAGLGAAATATAASGTAAFAADGPSVRWRLTSSFPKSLDALWGAAPQLAKRVSELTGGRFDIRPFAAGEIVPGLQVLDAVQRGTVECGHTAGYYYVGKDAAFAFEAGLPFGLTARQQNAWLYHGGGLQMTREFLKDYNIINFPGGNTGTQMGGWWRKEVKNLNDLKGLKVRIPGFGGKIMAALGAVPQTIAGGDIYPALEKGTIDAAEWVGPYDDEKLGFQKVARFYYYPGFWEPGPSLSFYVNLDAWSKLPKSYQAALEVAAAEVNITMTAEYDAKNPAALNRLIQSGAQLRIYPRDILDAAYKEAEKLYADESKNNPKFKKIFTSWNRFRNDQNNWFRVAENSMASYIPRSK
ncbi:TRAP transporter substrate-binding protein [Limnobacter sp.]|jgi:TRAP-type mannitol/chloroaromatic compound transport system substrate-binding protein|uniref:TRAP transporter substrate-binding protein n=1 Tax=Limnobacter sp. TaxID=2003368 RepID=UPI0039C8F63F